MKLNELADQCEFLSMKLEALSMGLESCVTAWEEINKVSEAVEQPQAPLLMLPAPEKIARNRCPVCKKFLKKDEEIHEQCKTQSTES